MSEKITHLSQEELKQKEEAAKRRFFARQKERRRLVSYGAQDSIKPAPFFPHRSEETLPHREFLEVVHSELGTTISDREVEEFSSLRKQKIEAALEEKKKQKIESKKTELRNTREFNRKNRKSMPKQKSERKRKSLEGSVTNSSMFFEQKNETETPPIEEDIAKQERRRRFTQEIDARRKSSTSRRDRFARQRSKSLGKGRKTDNDDEDEEYIPPHLKDEETEKNKSSDTNLFSRSNPQNEKKPKPNAYYPPPEGVPRPRKNRLSISDLYGESNIPDYDLLRMHFIGEGKIHKESALRLIGQVVQIFKSEENVLIVDEPVYVIGDLHGQFYDLLHILDRCKSPSEQKFLFLGNYVSRGTFSTETLFYLYALKINFPNQIYLLRGNHETRVMTQFHNFRKEVLHKYDHEIYEEFLYSFDCLPLAGIVQTDKGDFFCCHGGLSPAIRNLDDIDAIDRFQEPSASSPSLDLLWSDPCDPSALNQRFSNNPDRGCSFFWGRDAILRFLRDNDFICLIRGHQVKQNGLEEHWFRDNERDYPYAITIFSAPNFCDAYQNQGAYLVLGGEKVYKLKYVAGQDHPFCFKDFSNAFKFTLPFIAEHALKFLLDILTISGSFKEDQYPDSDSESKEEETLIKNTCKAMLIFRKSRQTKQKEILPFEVPPSQTGKIKSEKTTDIANLSPKIAFQLASDAFKESERFPKVRQIGMINGTKFSRSHVRDRLGAKPVVRTELRRRKRSKGISFN